MKNIDLSIVMCFRNEDGEPEMTVRSIAETCGNANIEILAINDRSDTEPDFSSYPQVRYKRNPKRLGVAACRDAGVAAALSDNLLIIDAHMRFRKDNWVEKGIAAIEENPKTIFCTKSIDIGSGNFDLKQTVLPMKHGLPYYVGCDLTLFLTQKDNPRKPDGFRNIIESRWAEERYGSIYQVPCLMGSNYFFKKCWYQKLHGFRGLKTWGNSEPFISLKSWLSGSEIKILKDIEIGHLYRRQNPNRVPREHIIYNKAVIARVLFTPPFAEELIDFLGDSPAVDKAKDLLKTNAAKIEAERDYFASITVCPERECFRKLRMDDINPLSHKRSGVKK